MPESPTTPPHSNSGKLRGLAGTESEGDDYDSIGMLEESANTNTATYSENRNTRRAEQQQSDLNQPFGTLRLRCVNIHMHILPYALFFFFISSSDIVGMPGPAALAPGADIEDVHRSRCESIQVFSSVQMWRARRVHTTTTRTVQTGELRSVPSHLSTVAHVHLGPRLFAKNEGLKAFNRRRNAHELKYQKNSCK